MSVFSKTIESIIKSFGKEAGKASKEAGQNATKSASKQALESSPKPPKASKSTHTTPHTPQAQKSTTNNAIMPNQNPQRQGMQANPKNPSKSTTPAQKQIHKEQRGIYNVTYNGKNATYINLQEIDLRYAKGNKNKGGTHIRLEHSLDAKQQGYVTPDEVANLGQNLRQYLAKHKEPFIDKNGSKIYEWEKDNVKFRAVVNKSKGEGNSNLPQLPKPLSDEIITFYSDRNLKNPMNFKNPALNPNKQIQQNALDFSLESSFNRK